MMNFWKTFVLAMLVMVGVASCAVEDEELATGADEGASGDIIAPASPDSGEEPQFVAVPEELSFAQLPEGTVHGNSYTAQACRVTLVYCRDRDYLNLPSYCQNGGCAAEDAARIARRLCRNTCGSIQCEVMGRRPRC